MRLTRRRRRFEAVLNVAFYNKKKLKERDCDHPGCSEAGEHRAPRSRSSLHEYYWFCLHHVQEYNQKWDYYAGMSSAKIEEDMRRSATWERPSWPFGRAFDGTTGYPSGYRPPPPLVREVQQALAVLDLEGRCTFAVIKQRYRTLVKQHHPDWGAPDDTALKKITEAYAVLKKYQALFEVSAPGVS